MSFFLAYETKGLLIGEGVDRDITTLRLLVEADPGVAHVSRLLTMYFRAPRSVAYAGSQIS